MACSGTPAKAPDHFAYHIGLAGMLPFIEEVIVNADGCKPSG